jgi:signal transduction histidine kinase
MKMSIRTKLLLSFLLTLALIGGLVLFAIFSIRLITESNRQLVYVQEKAGIVSDFQITLDRAITTLGDYLITGKRGRRSTFVQLVLLYRRQFETLEQLQNYSLEGTEDISRAQRLKIQGLKAEIEKIDLNSRELMGIADTIEKEHGHELMSEVGEAIQTALVRKSELSSDQSKLGNLKTLGDLLGVSTRDVQIRLEELEMLRKTISESRLQELSAQLIEAKDRALEKIGEIRELTQQEGKLAAEMSARATGEAQEYLLVGTIVIFSLGIGLAVYLSRSLSQPVLELAKGARLIGEGRFDYRFSLDTGDEIQELAERFNDMTSKLKVSYGALEERVRERTRALEQSHEQLRRLFDGISDGISIIDRNFKIVNVNRGIIGMVGCAGAGDLKGGRCYAAYNGGGEPCAGCPAVRTFQTGIPASGQLVWAVPGQKTKEMEIAIFPLMEQDGIVTQIIEYAKDISDKKAMERKLFQSAKLAAIGTLAAGVAHEIRNPLGIIKTSADIIKKNSRREEQNHELADFMIGEVDRLNRVVTRLLDFARPSQPKYELCNISTVIEKALALVGPQYRIDDLRVEKMLQQDIPSVRADGEQLCQVFLNLIINAAQAMENGGRLVLSTGANGEDAVWASVSDTGPGIDRQILDNIFDPFFTTKKDGSGLGLAIVYRIVEGHKGRVEVKSSPGKGTTVTVVIPVT